MNADKDKRFQMNADKVESLTSYLPNMATHSLPINW